METHTTLKVDCNCKCKEIENEEGEIEYVWEVERNVLSFQNVIIKRCFIM